MTFSEQLQTDMAVFINTAEFAESVTYKSYGEESVTISAVVVRGEITKQQIGAETYIVSMAVALIEADSLLATPNPDGDILYLDDDLDTKWEVESAKPVGANVAYKISATNKQLASFEA